MRDGFCRCSMCRCDVAGQASYYAYGSRLCYPCFLKVTGMNEQPEESDDAVRGIANAIALTICILAGLICLGWWL